MNTMDSLSEEPIQLFQMFFTVFLVTKILLR